jgi:hypothetical protein
MQRRILIKDRQVEIAPGKPGILRVSVSAQYQEWLDSHERIWFELPERYGSQLNKRGDPWLLFMLPLAVSIQAPLRVSLPVDAVLLANLETLMEKWHRWYPQLKPIPIETEPLDPTTSDSVRTAAFFSGGVDSMYSLLHQDQVGQPLDELLFIHGFDISVRNELGFQAVKTQLQNLADHYNKNLITMASNLRQTRFDEANWIDVGHGCMLAGCALQLEGCYNRVLISSTLPAIQLRPFGSHVDTDHLLSSSAVGFQHYGTPLTRYDKLELLLDDQFALDHLRVCYESTDGGNCGRCLKCVIVMTMLEGFGALERSKAFGAAPLDLNLIRNTYISQGVNSFRNIQEFARSRGRMDIVEAVEDAFDRTERLDRIGLGWLRRARSRLRASPAARRLTRGLRPALWQLGRWLNHRVAP